MNNLMICENPKFNEAWIKKLEEFSFSTTQRIVILNQIHVIEKHLASFNKEDQYHQSLGDLPTYGPSYQKVRAEYSSKLAELMENDNRINKIDFQITTGLNTCNFVKKKFSDPEDMCEAIAVNLPEDLDTEELKKLSLLFTKIGLDNLDELIIKEMEERGIKLTPEMLNVKCKASYRAISVHPYLVYSTHDFLNTNRNFELRALLLGEAYRYNTKGLGGSF